uniref:Cilia- and flagella-associated protein 206 n=1 Tax=Panagrellus redivivus TaxID=6233 RepID=A0A7E4V9U6_PANRE
MERLFRDIEAKHLSTKISLIYGKPYTELTDWEKEMEIRRDLLKCGLMTRREDPSIQSPYETLEDVLTAMPEMRAKYERLPPQEFEKELKRAVGPCYDRTWLMPPPEKWKGLQLCNQIQATTVSKFGAVIFGRCLGNYI